MANEFTKQEYAIVEALEEQAIHHYYYTVSCAFCDEEGTSQCDYPSSAAQEAFREGYIVHTFSNGESYSACKKCQEKEAWKEWEDDEETEN